MTFVERAIAIVAAGLLLSACQDLTPVPPPDTGVVDEDASTDGGGDETTDDAQDETGNDASAE